MAKCRMSWFRIEKSSHIAMKSTQGYAIHVACETIKCLLCSSLPVLVANLILTNIFSRFVVITQLHIVILLRIFCRVARFFCFNQILFLPHNSFGRIDCLTMSSSSEGIILLPGDGTGRDAPKLLKRAIRTRLKNLCWK